MIFAGLITAHCMYLAGITCIQMHQILMKGVTQNPTMNGKPGPATWVIENIAPFLVHCQTWTKGPGEILSLTWHGWKLMGLMGAYARCKNWKEYASVESVGQKRQQSQSDAATGSKPLPSCKV